VVPLPRRGTGCSEGEKLPRKCAVCAASVGKSASSDRLGSGLTGDAGAARALYAELLPIRERVLGPEHPRTQAARADLAYWTRQADGARSLMRRSPLVQCCAASQPNESSRRWLHNSPWLRPGGQSDGLYVYASPRLG
jgi:hypothetical protein